MTAEEFRALAVALLGKERAEAALAPHDSDEPHHLAGTPQCRSCGTRKFIRLVKGFCLTCYERKRAQQNTWRREARAAER